MDAHYVTSSVGGQVSMPFNTMTWLVIIFFLSIAFTSGGNISGEWFIQGAASFLYIPAHIFTSIAGSLGILAPIALIGLVYAIKGVQGIGEDFFLLALVAMIIILIGV